MIKCLHSRVSRWKVNTGENADTAPNLCPSVRPLPPHRPSVHPIMGALSECECMFVKGCAPVCMHLLCMCVCVCVVMCVRAVQSHPWLKGKGTQLCLQGTTSSCVAPCSLTALLVLMCA